MLTQGVSDSRHRECDLLSSKKLVDRFSGLRLGGVGQVQIDHRRLQRAVAEVLLDDLQRHTGFE